MKSVISYNALIRAIEKVYFKVSLNVLHKRMDGYHKQASHGMQLHSGDIKSPLSNCIDDIIANAPNAPNASEATDAKNTSIPVSSVTNTPTDTEYSVDENITPIKENVGELSKYFKARNNGSSLPPGIEEKLEQSTWGHINAAIRYANLGDKENAKMHANIASSACSELAHFITKEQYQAFIIEIEKHLDSIKQSKKDV